ARGDVPEMAHGGGPMPLLDVRHRALAGTQGFDERADVRRVEHLDFGSRLLPGPGRGRLVLRVRLPDVGSHLEAAAADGQRALGAAEDERLAFARPHLA